MAEKGQKRRHRASKAELERRRRTAEDMLSVGITHGDVVRQLAEKYEISERQAENYIRFIYARWKRLAPSEGDRRDQLIKMAHTVYTGALQKKEKDFRAANQAIQILIRLYGVGTQTQGPDPLANFPADKDRFAADRNYQILTSMRDQLARMGAAGDAKAAAEAASISATITELYGTVKLSLSDEDEARAVAAAKRTLVNARYFGVTDPQILTGRQDDFAAEQVAKAEDAKK